MRHEPPQHLFSPGPEIEHYISDFVAERELAAHIRFGTHVTEASWENGRWRLWCADGTEDHADVVISATGVLREPLIPNLPGLDTFEGEICHPARWDSSLELRGRRVAVIGTGSTGVQIVSALAGVASKLVVFQRSRHWVMKLPNPEYSERTHRLLRRFPWISRAIYTAHRILIWGFWTTGVVRDGLRRRAWQALVRNGLRRNVRDPELRAKMTPDYQPLCKRLIISPNYFDAIQHPATELITDPIDRIEPGGIRVADGTLHEVDVILLATGFDAQAFMRPMQITGRDGLTIDQAWADGPRAYHTVALPGFPNFFTIMGPHSPVGNYSLVAIAENQIGWIMRWLTQMRAGKITSVEPTQRAMDAYYAKLRAATPGTVWATGCQSWYHAADGTVELWPWTPAHHRKLLADEPVLADFDITRPSRTPAAV